MALDQPSAVNKITEHINQQGAPSLQEERVVSSKEYFQTFLSPLASSSSQLVDPRSIPVETESDLIHSFTLGDDNVTAQKSGTASDDQRERKKQDEAEEIEELSGMKKENPQDSSSQENRQDTENGTVESASQEAIKKEIKTTLAHIDVAKEKLSQPGAAIKPSYQTLIRNRLGHIDEHIQIALSKTGVEGTPAALEKNEKTPPNPVVRILESFIHAGDSINHLLDTVGTLGSANGKGLNPAALLAIQIKSHHIQQEVELLSNLLNKALEGTKTIMNVQV